jgi:tetratricopeptide (TPR) repeat protein
MHQSRVWTFKKLTLAGFLVLSLTKAYAATATSSFDQANRLYEQGKYAEAATIYENILKSGRSSSALDFNLGNAYFKDDQLGRALFHYRKAERMAPRDPDIQANLRFARGNVADTISINSPAWERVLRYFSINELATSASILFWIWTGIFCVSQLRPSSAPRLRIFGFITGSMLAVAVILVFTAYLTNRFQVAIVTSPEKAMVHLGPLTESQPSFIAADGSELELLARRENWLQVRDRLNRSGWIQGTNVLVFPAR